MDVGEGRRYLEDGTQSQRVWPVALAVRVCRHHAMRGWPWPTDEELVLIIGPFVPHATALPERLLIMRMFCIAYRDEQLRQEEGNCGGGR